MSRTASRAGLVRRSRALAAIRVLCPPPLPITAATHEAALVIAGHTGYAIYDALIIACNRCGGITYKFCARIEMMSSVAD
jgi:hypothetical protein